MAQTQGLVPYLQQQGIDSTELKDFIVGFIEGAKVDKKNKKAFAKAMGEQIGQQICGNLETIALQIFEGDSTLSLNKNNVIAGFIAGTISDNSLMQIDLAQGYVMTAKDKIIEDNLKTKYAKDYADNSKFLEENKAKEGVVALPSGLQYKVVKQGTGALPEATAKVKVLYEGRLINDTIFDSTAKNDNKPFEFSLSGGVIQGWLEGVKLMPVGSKYTFYIPYDLAYGARGRQPSIPPYATLVFDIELLEIVK
jgi:FKBP-type peptidyl-prolyl cis-trans isomerase FklB